MDAILFIPLTLATFGFLAWAIVEIVRTARRGRLLKSPREGAYQAARRLGAAGSPPAPRGGGFTIHRGDRAYLLTGSDFGKHGPRYLWLGTSARIAARGPGGSAFRDKPELTLKTLPHVVMRAETGLDRVGKMLGLNRELQAADGAFDRHVYVEHEGDEGDTAALLAVSEVQRAVVPCLDADTSVVLNAEGHAIALRWRAAAVPDSPETLDAAMANLAALADAVPAIEVPRLRPGRSKLVRVLGVVVGTVVGGALFAFSGPAVDRWEPLDTGFAGLLLGITLPSLALALAVGWWLSRGRPRGFARFLAIVWVTLGVGPALIGTTAIALNASEAEARSQVVTGVTGARKRKVKKGHRCTLDLEPWRDGLRSTRKLDVPCASYGKVKVGDRVTVCVARGRLGYEWIESIQPGSGG